MSLSTNGEFDAHILRIDRNQELKKKFGISYTRFAEIDPTPIKKWLVKDFLGAGEMSCAYGPPGSAKSLLAGDLAAHVAWGQDWMGRASLRGQFYSSPLNVPDSSSVGLPASVSTTGLLSCRWPSSRDRLISVTDDQGSMAS
jgi:AAA domain